MIIIDDDDVDLPVRVALRSYSPFRPFGLRSPSHGLSLHQLASPIIILIGKARGIEG